jgi:hypothetical protein
MHNIGVLYAEGIDGKPDFKAAAQWFRKSATFGIADSQYNLAVLYTQGLGVPRNLKEAANLMRKAADQKLAAGETGLGVAYENGDGVPPDPIEAAKWYQKAVDQDYLPAMNNLAQLLITTSNSTVRNPKRAIVLAAKASAGGINPEYLDTLAAAYFADGQTDKAIETEEKALARDPDNDAYKKLFEKYSAAAHAGH